MNTKKRILVFFIFMGLFSLAYQIGAMSEVSEEEAFEFMKEFEELIDEIEGVEIFLHNVSIALTMFIPGFGIAWGFYSGWSTGWAFAAIVLLAPPALSKLPPLALLYATPFGLMELVAYSIATSRSFILTHMIIKKINLRTAIRGTVIEIGIVVGLLLAGGILEFYMIELAESGVDIGVF